MTIPDSVISIGDHAFEYCGPLTSVYISDIASWCGIEFVGSSSNPLCYADKLYLDGNFVTELVIPDSVTSISDLAFYSYYPLETVTFAENSQLSSIGNTAFAYCTNLKSINIPDSVTSIGNSAFRGCSDLTKVYINDIESWCGIEFSDYDSNPLFHAHNLYLGGNLVTELVIPDSVTSIGYLTFAFCDSLTSITIGDSVTNIGDYAFYNCGSLTSVIIPDSVTSIGDYAFYECRSLTSITIPDNVISIGNHAFEHCQDLTSVTIGDGVTSIGNHTFYYCYGLTSVTIGDSVTSIGDDAFYACDSLTFINYCGSEAEWNAISKGDTWDQGTGNYTVVYDYKGEKPPVGTSVGSTCPNISIDVVESGAKFDVQQENANGKAVVLNFWYTTCGPCLEKLPYFYQAAKDYKDEISVIAIHIEQPNIDVTGFIENGSGHPEWNDVSMTIGWDTANYCVNLFNIQACPVTVVINADGVITDSFVGSLENEELVAAIEKALGQ